jgi:hypothetical protein
MIVFLFVVAAVAVSGPVVAAVLVSVASRREDSAWTLGGSATGLARATARRIVGFHAKGIEWPRPEAHCRLESGNTPVWEQCQHGDGPATRAYCVSSPSATSRLTAAETHANARQANDSRVCRDELFRPKDG